MTYDAETNEVVEELAALLDVEQELTVTEAHLEQLRCRVTDTIEHGDPDAQKGLLQALVARIEVESRAAVLPYFRVPLDGTGLTGLSPSDNGKVRPPSESAPPGGLEPPTVCLEGSCSNPLSYGGLAWHRQLLPSQA